MSDQILPIIGRYVCEESSGPCVCSQSNPSMSARKCFAELILHDEYGNEEFLCKQHAAMRLTGNPSLLARAVIELALARQ